MTDHEEQIWEEGRRAALTDVLRLVSRDLEEPDIDVKVHLNDVRATLRRL